MTMKILPKAAVNLRLYHPFTYGEPEQLAADDPPLFLSTDGVHGVIEIDYNSVSPARCGNDIIKLCLYGKLHIRIPSGEKGAAETPRFSVIRTSFLSLVEVIPMSTANASTSPTGQVTVKFDLSLPSSLCSSIEDHDLSVSDISNYSRKWSHLPSSLSVTSVLGSDPYCCSVQRLDAKASYVVEAQVFRNNETIGSVSREIRLFDGTGLQPPTCLSDFPSEYLCEEKDALRKYIFSQVGIFSAAIAEPGPFLFCDGNDFAMTRLPICFAVQGPNAQGRGDATNPTTRTFSASITWQLKTLTFMSAEPMHFVPTILQARRTPSITLITTLGRRHQLKLALSGWNKPRSTASALSSSKREGDGNGWAIIEEELALSIPTRCLLAPTFATPHLSRRYSLTVQVRVAGYGKASVRLEVPVQIVYQKRPVRTGDIHDGILDSNGFSGSRDPSGQFLGADAVAELPVYVP